MRNDDEKVHQAAMLVLEETLKEIRAMTAEAFCKRGWFGTTADLDAPRVQVVGGVRVLSPEAT